VVTVAFDVAWVDDSYDFAVESATFGAKDSADVDDYSAISMIQSDPSVASHLEATAASGHHSIVAQEGNWIVVKRLWGVNLGIVVAVVEGMVGQEHRWVDLGPFVGSAAYYNCHIPVP
jgi:hypothetical protein